DVVLARQLENYLTESGFQPRRLEIQDLAGLPLLDEILAEIDKTEVFVPIITARSAQSEWVRREVEIASDKKRRKSSSEIAPLVLVDPTQLDTRLSRLGYVPARVDGLNQIHKAALVAVRKIGIRSVRPLPL